MPGQTQKNDTGRIAKNPVTVRGNTTNKQKNLMFVVHKAEGPAIVTCVIEHAQPHLVVTLNGIRMDSFELYQNMRCMCPCIK